MAYSHKLVKRSFFTGKFDREFSGQENAITAAGMVYANNVISSPQGECKARPGTEFLSDISGESVIIPFRRADKDLALVFSDSVLQLKTFNANGKMIDFVPSTATRVVWTNTDNNTPSTTPLSVTGSITGDTSIVYKYWTLDSYTLTTNYTNNRIFINQMANPWTKFTMRFTAKKALNTVGMEVYPADGNWDQRYLDSVKEWVQDAVLQYSDDGTNWTTAQLASSAYWSVKREATPAGELYVRVLNFDLLQTDLHEYWQVVVIWNRQNMLNNAPVMVRFADTVYEQTTSAVSALTTPYTVNLLKKLKYSQQDNELIICDGQHNPYKFYMNGNVPHWEEQNTYSFLATDGVPSCVRFFQNRLFFGGFDAFPNRVRGSKFATDSDRSHYNDFTVVHQNATVADPINVECNQFSERITDLWGGFTVLYAQSSEGIAFVTGMSATPDFTLRCSERAAGITPTMKDNIMYYVGFDKRKIYAFSFDNNIQQFVAPDISQYWQEVLKNRISEIHYVDSRCKCVIGSLEDGTGFFLLHEGSMVGYFPFDISGQIYDVSVLKDGDDMHVIFVVNRENYWSIERLHLPEFMLETNAFEQTNWERNLATQKNLLKSPYFDSWRELSNEHNELWEYNAETKILSPAPATTNPVDLSSYVGDVVRCYYGDGIRDYTEARIDRVYSEQQTITEEIEVTENIYWYGWSNTTAITVAAIPGNDPAINGTLPRNSINDEQYYKAWYYAPLSKDYWTHDENPDIGNALFAKNPGATRARQVALITALTATNVFTKTTTPTSGDAVYNNNHEQIGTVTSVSVDGIVYNNTTFLRKTSLDAVTTETHTETITIIVESGQYSVDCELQENKVFNKILLPIHTLNTQEPIIQVQDNGIYCGTFNSENGVVAFEEPLFEIQYGIPYRKIAVIEDNRSYLRQKQWGAVAVNIIDTMALKVGIKLDKLTNMVKWDGNQFFDSNLIMKNGTLLCNIKDIPQYEKLLIFMTDEGLPFTLLAIETEGEISDRGAN